VAVVWSHRAREDLLDIFRFIARDDQVAAGQWVARLVTRAEAVATLPLGGRVVPEFGRADLRETFERSYRIVYLVEGTDVRVLTLFEGHRRLRASDIDDSGGHEP